MKFFCDRCNAKYSIADEKVRGKIVKVRCKRCDDIINVRGDQLGQDASAEGQRQDRAAGGRASQSGAETEWYYSVEGETFGPMGQSELERKYASGDVGESSYVWNDSFDDWKPAGNVEPFRTAIQEAKKAAARKRKNTLGVDGAVKSIEQAPDERDQRSRQGGRDDGRSGRDRGGRSNESNQRGRRSGGERGSNRQRETSDEGGSGGRSSRLDDLRNKLKSNFAGAGRTSESEPQQQEDERQPEEDLRETSEQESAEAQAESDDGVDEARAATAQETGPEADAAEKQPASEEIEASEEPETEAQQVSDEAESSDDEALEAGGEPDSEEPEASEDLEGHEDPTREFDPMEAIGDEESDLLEADDEAADEADDAPDAQQAQPEEVGDEKSDEPEEYEKLDDLESDDETAVTESDDEAAAAESDDEGEFEFGLEEQGADAEAHEDATDEEPAPTPEATGRDEPGLEDQGDVDEQPVGGLEADAPAPDDEGTADDEFELPPSGSERLEAGPAASGGLDPESGGDQDGLFADVDGDAADDDPEGDLTEEAELPTAPKLGDDDDAASESFGEQVSKSLLIQLDKIQKEGRGEAIWKTVLAAVLMAGMLGIWAYRYMNATSDDGPPVQDSDEVVQEDDEFKIRRYTEKERNKIRKLDARRIKAPEELPDEEEMEKGQPTQADQKVEQKADQKADQTAGQPSKPDRGGAKRAEAGSGNNTGGSEPTKLANKQKTAEEGDGDSILTRGGSLLDEDEKGDDALGNALDDSTKKRADKNKKGRKLEGAGQVAESGEIESRSSNTDLDTSDGPMPQGKGPTIDRPEDRLGQPDEESKIPPELSDDQIKDGMDQVAHSVGYCRKRHSKKGAPLEVGKIHLTVTVQPSGDVSSYTIDPKKVDGTTFADCLGSKKSRWDFGRFEGSSQQLKAPFIME